MEEDQVVVLGDTYCDTSLVGVVRPEIELPCTVFLLNIKATIRLGPLHHQDDGDDVSLFLEEENWRVCENETSIVVKHDDDDHNKNNTAFCNSITSATISETLSLLHVPLECHPSMVDRILFQAYNAAHHSTSDHRSDFDPKVLVSMAVQIEVYVAEC